MQATLGWMYELRKEVDPEWFTGKAANQEVGNSSHLFINLGF